jgi:hypothetical protein
MVIREYRNKDDPKSLEKELDKYNKREGFDKEYSMFAKIRALIRAAISR